MKSFSVFQACESLQRGGIIAYPTEAVYGLGCDPLNQQAVEKLLQIKHRLVSKGLILAASDFSQLEPFIQPVDAAIFEKIMQSWPGPTTWLLPANKQAPKFLRGCSNLQAVRISNHPVVQQLCDKLGSAIISTSANISGRRSARTALAVRTIFQNQIDYVINAKTGELSQPSQIINAITDEVIRHGSSGVK